MDIRHILSLLALAIMVATASAEISGQVEVSDGSIAWTSAGAIGGDLDADQDSGVNDDGEAYAGQDVEAEGTQAFASTGAIGAEGDIATTTSAVQDGELDTSQDASADEDGASAGQTTSMEGAAAYAGSYAEDGWGNYAGTEISAIAGDWDDAEIETTQAAETDYYASLDYDVHVASGNDFDEWVHIETEYGADAYQESNAHGSVVYAQSYAEDGDWDYYVDTEAYIEDGFIGTLQYAGADYYSAGTVQITNAYADYTWTYTEADSDYGSAPTVYAEGEFGPGHTSTVQAALSDEYYPEVLLHVGTDSDSSSMRMDAESEDVNDFQTGSGDEINQYGMADYDGNIELIQHP